MFYGVFVNQQILMKLPGIMRNWYYPKFLPCKS